MKAIAIAKNWFNIEDAAVVVVSGKSDRSGEHNVDRATLKNRQF